MITETSIPGTVESSVSYIAGRYAITRLLGMGGMGTVYEASDVYEGGRPVAVKVLTRTEIEQDGQKLLRFKSECDIASRLSHPNIVEVYDYGMTDSGSYYLTMECVNGGALRTRIKKRNPLRFDDVLRILREIADALAYTHSLNVLHRDLKPDNVLFTESDTVKLIDFGLARDMDAEAKITKTGFTIGTPEYMPPELATRKAPIDARADIYSLGIIAYEMVACAKPFTGESDEIVALKHLMLDLPKLCLPSGSQVPLWVRQFELPRWYGEMVRTCAQKDREQRFQSMDEVVAVLDAMMSFQNDRSGRKFVLERAKDPRLSRIGRRFLKNQARPVIAALRRGIGRVFSLV